MGALRSSLICTTVALAALDVFLAARLFPANPQAERPDATPRPASIAMPHQDAPAEAQAVAAHPPSQRQMVKLTAPRRESLEKQLKTLTDPATRAMKLRELDRFTRARYRGLARELRLSPQERVLVFELLTEQSLTHEVESIKSLLAGRDGWVDEHALDLRAREQLALVLGPTRFAGFMEFVDRLPERRHIAELQQRLGFADALQPAQAGALGEIMREERRRFTATMAGFGKNVMMPTGYPEQAREHDTNRASQLLFDQQQIDRVAEYHATIRERAATILNSQQLLRLQQMHENRLAPLRRVLVQRRRVDTEEETIRRASAQP